MTPAERPPASAAGPSHQHAAEERRVRLDLYLQSLGVHEPTDRATLMDTVFAGLFGKAIEGTRKERCAEQEDLAVRAATTIPETIGRSDPQELVACIEHLERWLRRVVVEATCSGTPLSSSANAGSIVGASLDQQAPTPTEDAAWAWATPRLSNWAAGLSHEASLAGPEAASARVRAVLIQRVRESWSRGGQAEAAGLWPQTTPGLPQMRHQPLGKLPLPMRGKFWSAGFRWVRHRRRLKQRRQPA